MNTREIIIYFCAEIVGRRCKLEALRPSVLEEHAGVVKSPTPVYARMKYSITSLVICCASHSHHPILYNIIIYYIHSYNITLMLSFSLFWAYIAHHINLYTQMYPTVAIVVISSSHMLYCMHASIHFIHFVHFIYWLIYYNQFHYCIVVCSLYYYVIININYTLQYFEILFFFVLYLYCVRATFIYYLLLQIDQ